MDGEPRRDLRAVLAGDHHAIGLKVGNGRLGHHLEFAIPAEQAEVGIVELADGAAGDQVNENPPLQLPQAVRRPQTAPFDAKWRHISGFMGWPTHPGTRKRPVLTDFSANYGLGRQFTPLLPGGKGLATCRGQVGGEL